MYLKLWAKTPPSVTTILKRGHTAVSTSHSGKSVRLNTGAFRKCSSNWRNILKTFCAVHAHFTVCCRYKHVKPFRFLMSLYSLIRTSNTGHNCTSH